MKIELTKGMLGDVVETIGVASSLDEARVICREWKDKNKDKYKVEPYYRTIYHDDVHTLVIDFGDYSYFFAIKFDSSDDWKKAIAEYAKS